MAGGKVEGAEVRRNRKRDSCMRDVSTEISKDNIFIHGIICRHYCNDDKSCSLISSPVCRTAHPFFKGV